MRRLFFVLVMTVLGGVAPVAEAQTTLTVVGHGDSAMVPDMGTVRAGITTHGPELAETMDENAAVMARMQALLAEAGVAAEDMQTSNLSLQIDWNYQAGELRGYRMSNAVTVRIRDLDKLGDILRRLAQAGANEMGNVSFELSDPGAAQAQARVAAMADARARAEQLAAAAGLEITGVIAISEGAAPALLPSPGARQQVQEALAVPIAAGTNTSRVSVSVIYALGVPGGPGVSGGD